MIVIPTIYEGQTTFQQEIDFFDDNMEPIPFDNCIVEMDLVRGEQVFKSYTTEDDSLLIENNTIIIPSHKPDLAPGTYLFDFKVTDTTNNIATGLAKGVWEIKKANTK